MGEFNYSVILFLIGRIRHSNELEWKNPVAASVFGTVVSSPIEKYGFEY